MESVARLALAGQRRLALEAEQPSRRMLHELRLERASRRRRPWWARWRRGPG